MRAWQRRATSAAAPRGKPASRHRRGSLRIGRCRPSSSPLPATAGPAPPPAAQCRAPGTASRRGCRTAARGRGTPDSGGRRSAGCTDGARRASASRCICGPCQSPSRAGWQSPRAGGPFGRSPGVTALAWSSGSDQPTKQTDTAKPEPHRAHPPYSPAGRARRARYGCRRRPKAQRSAHLHRGAPDRPVVSCPARVWLARPTL